MDEEPAGIKKTETAKWNPSKPFFLGSKGTHRGASFLPQGLTLSILSAWKFHIQLFCIAGCFLPFGLSPNTTSLGKHFLEISSWEVSSTISLSFILLCSLSMFLFILKNYLYPPPGCKLHCDFILFRVALSPQCYLFNKCTSKQWNYNLTVGTTKEV